MKRSAIRDTDDTAIPDSISFHPGYLSGEFIFSDSMVPGAGIEPARDLTPEGF